MKPTISFVLVAFLILLGSAKSDSLWCVFTQTSVRSDPNSEYHKLARDILKELIEINTTSRYGSIKAVESLAASSAYYNDIMRTRFVATMMNAGHAENALPQTSQAIINCRMLPDEDPTNVMSILKTVLGDSKISVSCIDSSVVAPLSPLREDVTVPVGQIASSMWPGVNVTPTMATGASDH